MNTTGDPVVATEALNAVVLFKDFYDGRYPVTRDDFHPKTMGADVDDRLNYINGIPYPPKKKKNAVKPKENLDRKASDDSKVLNSIFFMPQASPSNHNTKRMESISLNPSQVAKLEKIGQLFIDQLLAEKVVAPKANSTGFWFGGGNMTMDSEGTLG